MSEFGGSSHFVMVLVMLAVLLVVALSKTGSPWPVFIYTISAIASALILLAGSVVTRLTLPMLLDEFHLVERYHLERPDNIYDQEEVLEFSDQIIRHAASYQWWLFVAVVSMFLLGFKIGEQSKSRSPQQ